MLLKLLALIKAAKQLYIAGKRLIDLILRIIKTAATRVGNYGYKAAKELFKPLNKTFRFCLQLLLIYVTAIMNGAAQRIAQS